MINIENIKASCKERRVLYASDLRELCIKNRWYTKGTNEDYNNLFDSIRKKEITSDMIIDIAFDIFQHSNLQEESFYYVIFEVGRTCTTFLEY